MPEKKAKKNVSKIYSVEILTDGTIFLWENMEKIQIEGIFFRVI